MDRLVCGELDEPVFPDAQVWALISSYRELDELFLLDAWAWAWTAWFCGELVEPVCLDAQVWAWTAWFYEEAGKLLFPDVWESA